MITGILTNTPLYVWIILIAIVALGMMQARTRTLSQLTLLIMPGAMLAFSANTAISSFGLDATTIALWIAGLAAGFAINALVIKEPRGAAYDAKASVFTIPGSLTPLVVMLAIFSANYAMGITRAIAPSLMQTASFKAAICILLGACSGFLVSRAVTAMKTRYAYAAAQ